MTRSVFAAATAGVALYLAWSIGVAIRHESVFAAGPRLAQDPWTWVTIVDLYLGFLVAGGLIVARERRLSRWLPWLTGIALLGNLATAAYALRWIAGVDRRAALLPPARSDGPHTP